MKTRGKTLRLIFPRSWFCYTMLLYYITVTLLACYWLLGLIKETGVISFYHSFFFSYRDMSLYNSGLHGNIYNTLFSWKKNDEKLLCFSIKQARKNVLEDCLKNELGSIEFVKQSFIFNEIEKTCTSVLRFIFLIFWAAKKIIFSS